MNIDVFTRLAGEHETLLHQILDIQAVAETGDIPALVEKFSRGRIALTAELDAHMVLEDDVAFASVAEYLGPEMVLPFRAEHDEIRTLRDRVLAGADDGRVSIDLCLQLCDLLHGHMQREDVMLFPSALRT